MQDKKIAAYGLWHCDVSTQSLFALTAPPQYPFIYNGELYWLQAQPQCRGHIGLFKQSNKGIVCVTDAKYDLRTKVHVYGGYCHCVKDNHFIFNHSSQGGLYKQCLNTQNLQAISIETSFIEEIIGYADLISIPRSPFIVAVAEKTHVEQENENCLLLVNIDDESVPIVIDQGASFYANPAISADGKKIAWLEWNHPYMPWDKTRLVMADLMVGADSVGITNRKVIVDQDNYAVCQIGFVGNHDLLFVSDSPQCNFWNFFTVDDEKIRQITDEDIEFGDIHWTFGQKRWHALNDNEVIVIASSKNQDAIVKININSGLIDTIDENYADCRHIFVDQGKLVFIAGEKNRLASIVQIDMESRQKQYRYDNPQTLFDSISDSVFMRFSTADDEVAYGYFYPPNNDHYVPVENTRPPLIMMVHGGPTGKCSSEFAALKQYFCGLGFAVFDLNHRGSSGFGRRFRQRLIGQWGMIDTQDIFYAVQHLIAANLVDKDRVFIRGSSAGGYSVLRALTQFPKLFAAGASYYGIGNLITLSEVTHKFESRYTERLIGEVFDKEIASNPAQHKHSAYVSRSPIFDMDKIACPVIIFQGAKDEVVPPTLAHEVIDLFKQKKITHAYWEYAEEGHGFRSETVKQDALEKEIDFFTGVLKNKMTITP